jgi:hypothetical protein
MSLIGGKKRCKKCKSRKMHKGGALVPLSPATLMGGKKKSTRKKRSTRKRHGGLARVAVPASLLALRKLLKGSLKRKSYSRKSRSRKTRGRK